MKTTRRELLLQGAAVGAITTVPFASAVAGAKKDAKKPLIKPKEARVKSLVRRDETILRLGGIGDNFHMTWAADDRQYVLVNDGAGWDAHPKAMYNHRMFTISGDPPDVSFADVESYPELPHRGIPGTPRYYGWGTLAVGTNIYQFLSTSGADPTRFSTVKLIYSPDNGRSWRNQDGSSPVVWNDLNHINRETMIFINEPQGAFSMLSCLQMGRAYSANQDGYAYIYSPNGLTEGTMNQLVMLRVLKTRILDRSSYEYFSGIGSNGVPIWRKEINARVPVLTFPGGWVGEIPFSWIPSVVYSEPLDLYLMANYGWKYNKPAQYAPAVPSYLGFWTAPHPWGPWAQIHEETAWMPGEDAGARAFQPQIAPKWIAPDGKSLWLVWSDYQGAGGMDMKDHEAIREREGQLAANLAWHRAMKYYAFNTQRVDLVLA